MVLPFVAFAGPTRHAATSTELEVKVKSMDIGEVARASGLPASTLRFYEERGLIASVGRRGLRRVFEAGILERLALIGLGRAAGFSLEEIAKMFAPDGAPRIDRQALTAKAVELDQTIRRLQAMRDGLRHAAACKAPSHMECPTFRRLLRASAARSLAQDRGSAAPSPTRASKKPRPTQKQPARAARRRTSEKEATKGRGLARS
jgi:DNA-binding transcriptional MerR regulator